MIVFINQVCKKVFSSSTAKLRCLFFQKLFVPLHLILNSFKLLLISKRTPNNANFSTFHLICQIVLVMF